MPLDIANLDAPESESAPIGTDASGVAAPGGSGSANAGAPDPGSVSADPASTGDNGNGGSSPTDGTGSPEPAVKEKQATVPHHALHEARETNKQLRARIAELEAVPRLSAEDAQLLQELRAQRQPPKTDDPPDWMQDPKANVDSRFGKLEKKLEETAKKADDANEKLNQHQTIQAVIQTAGAQVTEFVAQNADYPKAIEHVRAMRRGQLEMLYPQATAEQVAQIVAREEITLAGQVVSRGDNFAEFAYNYAKRMGYQPPKPPDPEPAKKIDASAVRTLGSGGADVAPPATDDEDPNSEFRAAKKEDAEVRARFRRRA